MRETENFITFDVQPLPQKEVKMKIETKRKSNDYFGNIRFSNEQLDTAYLADSPKGFMNKRKRSR